MRANVIEAAEAAGYGAFAAALRAAGYEELLAGAGPFTAFAPSDAAFEKFAAAREKMFSSPALLTKVMGYHLTLRKVAASRIAGRRVRIVMQAGGEVILDGRTGFRINAANVVAPDLAAANGLIHGVDALLWPRAPAAAVSA